MGELLTAEAVRLDRQAADRDDAIRQCGQTLVDLGAVAPGYVAAMLERERSVTTYVGDGVAIPHATPAGRADVVRDALAVLCFPQGVDWGGELVRVCVAIAAVGDGQVELLGELALVLLDPERSRQLREAKRPADVLDALAPLGRPA